jgi:hypothetical protein
LTGWRKFEGERAVGEGGVGGARGGREGGLEGGEVVVEGRKEEGQRAWRFLLKCGGLGVRWEEDRVSTKRGEKEDEKTRLCVIVVRVLST